MRTHYAHLADKPFFPSLFEYLTSAPVLLVVIMFLLIVGPSLNCTLPADLQGPERSGRGSGSLRGNEPNGGLSRYHSW